MSCNSHSRQKKEAAADEAKGMIERDPSTRLRMTTDEIELKRSLRCGRDDGLVDEDDDLMFLQNAIAIMLSGLAYDGRKAC